MGSLVQQREYLEARVDELRAFEREYRSRLAAYFEQQLRELRGEERTRRAFAGVATGRGSAPSPSVTTAEQA